MVANTRGHNKLNALAVQLSRTTGAPVTVTKDIASFPGFPRYFVRWSDTYYGPMSFMRTRSWLEGALVARTRS